jgi:hypothetical protein
MINHYDKAVDVTTDLGNTSTGDNLELLYNSASVPSKDITKKGVYFNANTCVYPVTPQAIMITDATITQEKIEVIPLGGGPSIVLWLTVNVEYELALQAIVKRSDTTAKAVIILGTRI